VNLYPRRHAVCLAPPPADEAFESSIMSPTAEIRTGIPLLFSLNLSRPSLFQWLLVNQRRGPMDRDPWTWSTARGPIPRHFPLENLFRKSIILECCKNIPELFQNYILVPIVLHLGTLFNFLKLQLGFFLINLITLITYLSY
jgi:hypothetical protein